MSEPRSWLDRIVGRCFSLLVAALAAYVAVRLIEAVWEVLVVIAVVVGCVALAVVIVRGRNRGW